MTTFQIRELGQGFTRLASPVIKSISPASCAAKQKRPGQGPTDEYYAKHRSKQTGE